MTSLSEDPHSPQLNPAQFPLVSVVIPIYNGAADLPDLIACLQAQTYPPERVEYLLVDNGSRDRTPVLLETAVQTSASLGLTVRHLTETKIQSSYAARNAGIRVATGEIVAFTDADCRPQPDWLQKLIEPLATPEIGIVAGEIVALPGTSLLEHYADRQDTLSQKHTLSHPFCPYGQTANLALRRSLLEEVGLFRPFLTTGGDADICWRILKHSDWQIHFAEQAIVQHRHRATIAELRRQWQRYGRSNRYLHELHNVDLMRSLSPQDYAYRWSRWVLKEVPLTVLKTFMRKGKLSDLFDTPLGLMCVQARLSGQHQARLPAQARQIEWLSASEPCSSSDRLTGMT